MLWPPPLMLSSRHVRTQTNGRGDVGGRGRLEDERRRFRDHAVPDQHGVVPPASPARYQALD